MIKYIIFLAIGIFFGAFIPYKNWIKKLRVVLFPFSILSLLFFMGVEIGKDPHLRLKILNYGYFAAIISVSSIFFSVLAVFIVIKVYKFIAQREI